jgi:hypothetical protein
MLLQHLLFQNAWCRERLGIMAIPPKSPNEKPRRPGIKGYILDRIDYIKLAFRNYIKEAAERRRKYNKIAEEVVS